MAVTFRSIDALEVGPFAHSPQVLIEHSSPISQPTNVQIQHDEVVEDSLKDNLALVRAHQRSKQRLELVSESRLGTTTTVPGQIQMTEVREAPATRADSITPPKPSPQAPFNAEQMFARHEEVSKGARSTNRLEAAGSKRSKSSEDRNNGQENQPVSSAGKPGKLPQGSVSAALRARKERPSALKPSTPAEPLAQRSNNVTTTEHTSVEQDEFELVDELAEQSSLKKPKKSQTSKPPARAVTKSSKSMKKKGTATANSGRRLSNKDAPTSSTTVKKGADKKGAAKLKQTKQATSDSGKSATQHQVPKRKSDTGPSRQSPALSSGSVYHKADGRHGPLDELRRSDRLKRPGSDGNEEGQPSAFANEPSAVSPKKSLDHFNDCCEVPGQKPFTEGIDRADGGQSHGNNMDAISDHIVDHPNAIKTNRHDQQRDAVASSVMPVESPKAPGKSQATAIMVEDMGTSSDMDSPSSLAQHHSVESAGPPPKSEGPELERVGSPPSSPPQIPSARKASSKTPAFADRARKATIIGFDKFGPRNQGALLSSTKRPRTDRSSSPLMQDSVIATKKGKGKRAVDDESSRPRSDSARPRSRDTSHKQGSSSVGNVAETMGDAFNSLLAFKRPASMDPPPEPPSKRRKADESLPSIDPKIGVDENSDVEAFLQNDDSNIDIEAVMPRSPEADHRPALKPVTSDRTTSQIIMPPPSRQPPRVEKPQSSQPHPLLLENMSKRNIVSFDQPETLEASAHHSATKKQSTAPKGSTVPVSNGLKALALKSSLPNVVSGFDAHIERLPLDTGLEQGPEKHEAKKPFKCHNETRVVRRRSSRTVDTGGSPVPQDMDIAEDTTVLETYTRNGKSPIPQNLGSSEQQSILEPGAKPSDANLRSYLREVSPRRIGVNHSGRQRVLHDEDYGALSDLRNHQFYSMLRQKKKDYHDERDPQPAQSRQSDSSSKLTKLMDDKINQLQSHINLSKVGPITKKHPVNPTAVDKHKAATVDVLASGARLASTGNLAAAKESVREHTDNRAQEKYDQDLAIWRSALRPHQLKLHDELTNIAHRLTQHLVDDEVTLARSVEDYRRRSLTVIEKMEAQRCELYRRLEESLERKREAVKDELRVFERVLQGCKHGVTEMRTEIDRKRLQGKEMERDIEMLIERWG